VIDVADQSKLVSSKKLVGYQGLGVMTSPEDIDFTQGGLMQTEQTYDLAIEGNGFFRLDTPEGERYTRDGRFLRDADGQLTNIEGYLVLNTDGQPIDIPDGVVTITPDGTIQVDNAAVDQIGLAAFEDPAGLIKAGDNFYLSEAAPTGQADGTINQGYLEASNVNTAQLMSQMVTVARAYEAAQKMVQIQDELIGRSISQLGRL
jgi:flagellar basal body rod protein FlgG